MSVERERLINVYLRTLQAYEQCTRSVQCSKRLAPRSVFRKKLKIASSCHTCTKINFMKMKRVEGLDFSMPNIMLLRSSTTIICIGRRRRRRHQQPGPPYIFYFDLRVLSFELTVFIDRYSLQWLWVFLFFWNWL